MTEEKKEPIRNLIAFWFIGLLNNFSFVVMLSGNYNFFFFWKEESHFIIKNYRSDGFTFKN